MILLLITLGAVFLAGVTLGAFALIVIGIRLDARQMARIGKADTRVGAGPRHLLATGLGRPESRR